jgi:hypothetical protein
MNMLDTTLLFNVFLLLFFFYLLNLNDLVSPSSLTACTAASIFKLFLCVLNLLVIIAMRLGPRFVHQGSQLYHLLSPIQVVLIFWDTWEDLKPWVELVVLGETFLWVITHH